jgi:hypothetical protein
MQPVRGSDTRIQIQAITVREAQVPFLDGFEAGAAPTQRTRGKRQHTQHPHARPSSPQGLLAHGLPEQHHQISLYPAAPPNALSVKPQVVCLQAYLTCERATRPPAGS